MSSLSVTYNAPLLGVDYCLA